METAIWFMAKQIDQRSLAILDDPVTGAQVKSQYQWIQNQKQVGLLRRPWQHGLWSTNDQRSLAILRSSNWSSS